jgi:hypothetical protein
MVWEPFLLAIFFGLLVSAGIYFAVLWPQVEPLDEEELAALGPSGAAAVAIGGGGGAADADDDDDDDEDDEDDAAADAGAKSGAKG